MCNRKNNFIVKLLTTDNANVSPPHAKNITKNLYYKIP